MSWWQRLLEWLRRLFGRSAAAAVGCVDLSTLTDPLTAPLKLPGTSGGMVEFRTSTNRTRTANGNTGLDCDVQLDIFWSQPASQLTLKLIHTAQPATIEAKDSAGAVLKTVTQPAPQHVVSTVPVPVPAPGATQATVLSPANEVVLIEFCAT